MQRQISCNRRCKMETAVHLNFLQTAAKIEGEVVSTGTIKIGLGSVIIGNVTSTSAVIAGAIKGDIDVQGPVVVDTSCSCYG